MQPESGRNRSEEFVRTAAFLKREFEGRNLSERDETRNVIYVFDSDIIKTKCAPWVTGPAGKGHGYGAIFSEEFPANVAAVSSEQEKKAEQIASILANYVLHLSATPVFQLPSHAKETNNVYRAVRRSVETFDEIDSRRTHSRRSFELARAIALVRHRASEGARKEEIGDAIEHVLGWLTHREDTKQARLLREWDAYYGLEAEFGGIYSLANAGVFFREERDLSDAFSVLQPAGRSYREDQVFQKLVDYWTGMFAARSRHNIEADAEALSHLFLINARLAGSKWKCVFVTGDRVLVKAAYQAIPSSLLPDEQKSFGDGFSLEYIRHLWSYSSDALIEPGNQQKFNDLFGGLLAAWSDELGFSIKKLELVSDGKVRQFAMAEDSVKRVLAEWEVLTNKSVIRLAMEEYLKNDALRKAIWDAVNVSAVVGDWEGLQARLLEEVDRIRDRTILSMSDLGIDFIIQADKLGRRNPPELVFDTLNNTNDIFKRLSAAGSYRDAKSFENDFAKIKEDCYDSSQDGDDRQQSHLKFLVLGAAFASAERWLIALSHAKRAIAIIRRSAQRGKKIPIKAGHNSHMSGREAYFLAAVAQRMLAASDRDFVRALEDLDNAAAALREDHREKTASAMTFARFDSERLAMALGRYYLARSKAMADRKDSLVSEVNSCATKMISPFLDWVRGSNTKTLRNVTVVNLSINLIQTFVISEFRQFSGWEQAAGVRISDEIVAMAVGVVKNLTNYVHENGAGKINATPLIRTYTIVGELFAAESSPSITRLSERLREVLANLDDVIVTRYDDWRYNALIDFVERRFEVKLR